jgi:hypothetical protein
VDLWLNVPVGATVTILTFARIREIVGPRAPLDVGGVVPATAAALGLVWGWSAPTRRAGRAPRFGWRWPAVWRSRSPS